MQKVPILLTIDCNLINFMFAQILDSMLMCFLFYCFGHEMLINIWQLFALLFLFVKICLITQRGGVVVLFNRI